MMTAEQRYNQAVLKARLIARRQLAQFLAGEIDILPCSGDLERQFIIAEIARRDAVVLQQDAVLSRCMPGADTCVTLQNGQVICLYQRAAT